MEPKELEVRIGKGEIDRIFNLKAEIDHHSALADYTAGYLKLGWPLVALDADTGGDLGIDFQDEENWRRYLQDPALDTSKINLGVTAGTLSRLLVLEVADQEHKSILDEWGEWRSNCVAELGTGPEKHFYLLPPDCRALPSISSATGVKFCGAGELILLPPSLDPGTQEHWRWQQPPWDSAPSPLPISILNSWHSLQEPTTSAGSDLKDGPVVSWQELYCLISPFETLLQAFTDQEASLEDYYQHLLQTALEAGLTDADLLLSLLCHAPRGDARQVPERWAYLQTMVRRSLLGHSPQSLSPRHESRPICFFKRTLLNSQQGTTRSRQPVSRRDGKK